MPAWFSNTYESPLAARCVIASYLRRQNRVLPFFFSYRVARERVRRISPSRVFRTRDRTDIGGKSSLFSVKTYKGRK
jgi:hypothetical protein